MLAPSANLLEVDRRICGGHTAYGISLCAATKVLVIHACMIDLCASVCLLCECVCERVRATLTHNTQQRQHTLTHTHTHV